MGQDNLIELGDALLAALYQRAAHFHEKSWQHEALAWEAVGVETRINMLKSGELDALASDALQNHNWGDKLRDHSPELAESVMAFYQQLYRTVAA
uniref:hypothetical protein n=1 Tax=Thaumasiovibrio occultus TaxID=1891184 RepID=UPI000B34D9DF|nr:hypothetical protein [Thaumasiovibrio occultus]